MLLVGLRNWRGMDALDNLHIKWSMSFDGLEINRSTPGKGYIEVPDGHKIPVHIIRHSSRYYTPKLWREYITEQMPKVMKFVCG